MRIIIFSLLLYFLCAVSGCSSNVNRSFSLRINPSVKEQALAEIDTMRTQNGSLEANYGKFNDSLRLIVDSQSGTMDPVFFWLNFDRSNNKAFLYCCGHTGAQYKLQKQDEPKQCIEVSFEKAELVLSAMPHTNSRKPIYGRLRFKSVDYYRAVDEEYKETDTEIDTYFIARFSSPARL